jgi:osmotically-inducible protein OsmY
VSDGVVHLWGTLKSDEQRRALEIAVQGVPGVRAVENHTRRDTFAEG